MWQKYVCLLLILVCYSLAEEEHAGNETQTRFQVVTLRWAPNETTYIVATWLLIAAISKILFHLYKPIANAFPDSSLLIAVGLLLGLLLKQSGAHIPYSLNAHVFFLYLLPPIIFDAGYFMPNRALYENWVSVLLFAVVGTCWNCIAIGSSLLFLSRYGLFTVEFSTTEIFVFSSLISAVDPVAVIAVFEEINVNEFIFVNVFGEALFNDGVTVVLYQMFKAFTLIGSENLQPVDYAAGVLSFFVVALGGACLGLIGAFIVSFITKYTNEIRILAPVFVFVIPYLAYLTAEVTSLSSIIAIAVCGMFMKQYVKGNITTAAANSVKYFTKMLAQSAETVIFMFLGLTTMGADHHWDTWFVVCTLTFCLVYRTIGVLVQCFFLNKFRQKQFSKVDQVILAYGGLRGAIAFGLAMSLPHSIMARKMFLTATLMVVFFTVILQGITIRPLIKYLNIKTKSDEKPTMAESIYNKYLDYMMSGVEDIAGQQGQYSIMDTYERFNAKVLQPILMRNQKKKNFDASTILRAYQKITLEDAMNLTKMQKAEHKRISALRDEELRGTYINKAFDREMQKDSTVTPQSKQLEKFLATGENVDNLYKLFSELLDRKLKELNTTREQASADAGDDIQDDYMREMASSNAGSRQNLRQLTDDTLQVNDPYQRGGRRQSTGGVQEQRKSKNWDESHNV
ncbi:unnamed protein product [Cylicocyclus nassatus]|uniref:Sodium/hydrogen exchanger n=1 Tax=Cylicocyclus nassatus TaxID=53992 RepID=A0AA36M997_CYLNA|nr:unnamed protein product [Cylicocyclus nassatus]